MRANLLIVFDVTALEGCAWERCPLIDLSKSNAGSRLSKKKFACRKLTLMTAEQALGCSPGNYSG